MARLSNPFDATQVDPTQGASQFPVGKHPVVIVHDEIRANKNQDGGLAALTLRITDGPSKGIEGEYRLNLYNKSEKAAEIAHKQLSAICHVTGVYKIEDLRQLHNIPFIIEVALQKDPEAAAKGYTEVKKVYDMNGNEPGKQNAGQQGAQTTQSAPQSSGNAWGGGAPANQQQAPQTAAGGNAWGGGNNAGGAQQQAPANQWGGGNASGGAPAGDKPSWAK